jgi:cell division protein FtsZ
MVSDIKIALKRREPQGAILKVIGVGGGGGNAVNRMIKEGLTGVDFIAVNTDIQDLVNISKPAVTLQIGEKLTKGLGTGSNAAIGMQAAQENTDAIIEMLEGSNMVFITAGMGGGTGTGASQVIANHASTMGILTVAVVTKPFEFEGNERMRSAEDGIKSLVDVVDAIIVIPNQKLFEIEEEDLPIREAYKKVDEILLKAVRGISDIINTAGIQNVDFADVKATMAEKGMTLMGTGEARGENRAEEAARRALTSPLLDEVDITGATGVLYNITTSPTSPLGTRELKQISEIIKSKVAANVKSKFGIVEDENLGDILRVTVIATGFSPKGTARQYIPQMPVRNAVAVTPQPHREPTPAFLDENLGTFLGKRNTRAVQLETAANGYITDSPSMVKNPDQGEDPLDSAPFQLDRGNTAGWNLEELLDTPSFQRKKIWDKS